MDRRRIVETYERLEDENGGLANVSPRHILELTAKELGIEVQEARSVMVDHWTMAGGG